jgi:hypothetical protein
MKKLIIFLLVVATFGSCTKKDVDPKTPTEAVVGLYEITYLSVTTGSDVTTFASLPLTQSGTVYSASAELSSTIEDKIDIRFYFKTNGVDDDPNDLEGFELRMKGTAYGLYLANQFIADLDGKNIDFNFATIQNGETSTLKFRAKR